MSNCRIIALSLILSFSLICPIYATTYYVDDSLGDDLWPGTEAQPKKTISAGIAAASDYDTVIVNNGTYRGPDNRNLEPGSKKITLRSAGGSAMCIIDAEGQDRAFRIVTSPAEATFSGFTIRNGVNEETFSGGGGGGGIYMHLSFCTIEDCIIEDCSAINGGGMLIRNSSATIRGCTIRNNIASHLTVAATGGGIYLFDNTNLVFEDCVFSGNQVPPDEYNGGAIFKNRGTDTFQNCVFEDNYSNINGGVLYIERGDTDFINCVFYGNEAGVRAACFYIVYPMQVPSTSVTVVNSIFWSNTATIGSIAVVRSGSLTDGVFNYSYCDIDPAEIDADGIVNASGVNINVDPLFASEGYSSGDSWISGDYHLESKVGRWDPNAEAWVIDAEHSPCIDVGDPCDSFALEPVPNGDRINMGAYGNTAEASKSPYCDSPIEADLNGDCKVDFADFAKFSSYWLDCNMIPSEFCW